MNKLLAIIFIGTQLFGSNELIKTDDGFMLPSKAVKTYYKNNIIWGKFYTDHNASSPVRGVAVVAWSESDNWKYITTTDQDGVFQIEVKPNSAFRLKASDGDRWATYGKILPGIPVGTIGTDK